MSWFNFGMSNKKKLVADIISNLALASVGESESIRSIMTEDSDERKCMGFAVREFQKHFDVNFDKYNNFVCKNSGFVGRVGQIGDKQFSYNWEWNRFMYATYLEIDEKAKAVREDFFKKIEDSFSESILDKNLVLRKHFSLFTESITMPLLSAAINDSKLWNLSQGNFFQKLWEDLSFSEFNDLVKERNMLLDCVTPYLDRWVFAFTIEEPEKIIASAFWESAIKITNGFITLNDYQKVCDWLPSMLQEFVSLQFNILMDGHSILRKAFDLN